MGWEAAAVQAVVPLRNPILTEVAFGVKSLGSIVFAGILVAGMYLLGEQRGAIIAAVSAGLSGTITYLLKVLVARPRPPVEAMLAASTPSFPSGHTTIAFALAVSLGELEPDIRKYLYLIASSVALTRIYLGVHYPSDILAGAVIGAGCGLIVVRYQENIPIFHRYL